MKKVLLIWNESPEEVKFVNLENPTSEQIEVLKKVNGSYINTDVDVEIQTELDKINIALSKEEVPEHYNHIDVNAWKGIWADNFIKTEDLPSHTNWDAVFICGFVF